MREHLKFITSFIRHPLSVGAVAPSSRWMARRMVEDMGLDEARTVVELGPGTGSFTRAIEERLHPDALFLALELDAEFAALLTDRCSRATVIQDSAEHIARHLEAHGRSQADAIFCGLPWASFPVSLQERIMSAVIDALRPGGCFATFAYVHACWFPTARKFNRWLRDRFPSVSTTRVIWRNFPPAFIYRCVKGSLA